MAIDRYHPAVAPVRKALERGKWWTVRTLVGQRAFGGVASVIPWTERTWEYPWVLRQIGAGRCRVLDVGPGEDTPLALWLAEQDLELWGCDLRPYGTPIPGFRFVQGDVTTTDDLPEGYFDVVLSVSVLEHLEVTSAYAGYKTRADRDYAVAFLRAMRRCVRPGGKVLVTTPAGRPATSDLDRPDAYRVLGQSEVEAMVGRAGLRIVHQDFVRLSEHRHWVPCTAADVAGLDSSTTIIRALTGLVLEPSEDSAP